MDFFTYQDAARKKTGVLVLYFAAAVALIIFAVYAALAAIGVFGSAWIPRLGEPWSGTRNCSCGSQAARWH